MALDPKQDLDTPGWHAAWANLPSVKGTKFEALQPADLAELKLEPDSDPTPWDTTKLEEL